MLNVLLNAYAVSPNWGSEQGMGWNWVINLAKYCNLDVITEGEWQIEIENALKSLPQSRNITFHYLPVSDKIRKMCWNQGDWRFYYYYAKWQKRALLKAQEIIENKRIDVIHQLNMVGFREPGYLWKIKNVPYVWGPVGGMELMPVSYLSGAPLKQRFFNRIKNYINVIQYSYSPRVRKAIQRSDIIISAVKGVKDILLKRYGVNSLLINETGTDLHNIPTRRRRISDDPLKILWVGKFDFRKQLPLAIRSVVAMNKKNIEFHICGAGSEEMEAEMKSMAEVGGIEAQCYWHGNIAHDKVSEIMAESDILFFTSIMEATSTVVLEAISVGLPVLCFNTCGFGPIVKEFAGITVELSDPNKSVRDFTRELLRLYKNRTLLDYISTQIFEKRSSLTWESKAIQMNDIYRSLITSGRNGLL